MWGLPPSSRPGSPRAPGWGPAEPSWQPPGCSLPVVRGGGWARGAKRCESTPTSSVGRCRRTSPVGRLAVWDVLAGHLPPRTDLDALYFIPQKGCPILWLESCLCRWLTWSGPVIAVTTGVNPGHRLRTAFQVTVPRDRPCLRPPASCLSPELSSLRPRAKVYGTGGTGRSSAGTRLVPIPAGGHQLRAFGPAPLGPVPPSVTWP